MKIIKSTLLILLSIGFLASTAANAQSKNDLMLFQQDLPTQLKLESALNESLRDYRKTLVKKEHIMKNTKSFIRGVIYEHHLGRSSNGIKP